MKNNKVNKAAVKQKKHSFESQRWRQRWKALHQAQQLHQKHQKALLGKLILIFVAMRSACQTSTSFRAPTVFSTSRLYQPYRTSQSIIFAPFKFFDTPQSLQSQTLSSQTMNYFLPSLVNLSFSTSTQAQHLTNSSYVGLITTTQPIHGGTNEQLWHSGMSRYPYEIVKGLERWSNAMVAEI